MASLIHLKKKSRCWTAVISLMKYGLQNMQSSSPVLLGIVSLSCTAGGGIFLVQIHIQRWGTLLIWQHVMIHNSRNCGKAELNIISAEADTAVKICMCIPILLPSLACACWLVADYSCMVSRLHWSRVTSAQSYQHLKKRCKISLTVSCHVSASSR